jgi:hypothetical protein
LLAYSNFFFPLPHDLRSLGALVSSAELSIVEKLAALPINVLSVAGDDPDLREGGR